MTKNSKLLRWGHIDAMEDKRNYALKGLGCIRIKMPQDRNSQFKSDIIRPHEQIDPRLKEDMAVLHLAGLSTRTMVMVSKRVSGIEELELREVNFYCYFSR